MLGEIEMRKLLRLIVFLLLVPLLYACMFESVLCLDRYREGVFPI